MAVQYAFSQITTTGLELAVDAADPLSYPGSGTSWTDVTGNGFTGTISSSISFATTFRGALVSSNSSSAVSFSGSAANFGTDSFTVEMAFSPSVINGQHWLYSKNSGSFPNFGAFVTGSGGIGRITAFYNISSTISSSTTTAVGSIVTGSNYIVDVTYAPFSLFTSVYLNSDLVSNVGANGSGSLATSASLLLLNNTTSSNSGTVGNLYNFKVYNPFIGSANIRKNYNSMCSRFGLPLTLYTPPAPLLLNLYPGAAAAYSLRLLNSDYDGAAIQVRRSSDNAVADIGFDGDGNLNTGALLAFCGAGNGFVTTWYDQSGNANNATQGTALSQPQIVSSGSVILQNGKPCVKFDGTDDFMQSPNTVVVNGLSNLHFYTVTQTVDTTIGNEIKCIYHFPETGSWGQVFSALTTNLINARFGTSQVSNNLSQSITTSTSLRLLTTYKNNTTDFIDVNNTNVLTATGKLSTIANTYSFFNLGKGTSLFANANISEFIFYPTNQISNNPAINTNINSYYSIY
jgi:hypothetical protein